MEQVRRQVVALAPDVDPARGHAGRTLAGREPDLAIGHEGDVVGPERDRQLAGLAVPGPGRGVVVGDRGRRQVDDRHAPRRQLVAVLVLEAQPQLPARREVGEADRRGLAGWLDLDAGHGLPGLALDARDLDLVVATAAVQGVDAAAGVADHRQHDLVGASRREAVVAPVPGSARADGDPAVVAASARDRQAACLIEHDLAAEPAGRADGAGRDPGDADVARRQQELAGCGGQRDDVGRHGDGEWIDHERAGPGCERDQAGAVSGQRSNAAVGAGQAVQARSGHGHDLVAIGDDPVPALVGQQPERRPRAVLPDREPLPALAVLADDQHAAAGCGRQQARSGHRQAVFGAVAQRLAIGLAPDEAGAGGDPQPAGVVAPQVEDGLGDRRRGPAAGGRHEEQATRMTQPQATTGVGGELDRAVEQGAELGRRRGDGGEHAVLDVVGAQALIGHHPQAATVRIRRGAEHAVARQALAGRQRQHLAAVELPALEPDLGGGEGDASDHLEVGHRRHLGRHPQLDPARRRRARRGRCRRVGVTGRGRRGDGEAEHEASGAHDRRPR